MTPEQATELAAIRLRHEQAERALTRIQDHYGVALPPEWLDAHADRGILLALLERVGPQ